MTVVESPKGRASHNLGNRGAIPPFPPPGYCYIFFQNLSRKESSSPPAPSRFRLILRLEKTFGRLVVRWEKPKSQRETYIPFLWRCVLPSRLHHPKEEGEVRVPLAASEEVQQELPGQHKSFVR